MILFSVDVSKSQRWPSARGNKKKSLSQVILDTVKYWMSDRFRDSIVRALNQPSLTVVLI